MNFVTSISLVVLGAMFLALLGWGSIRAAWRNCEGRRGVFAALAILAAICSIVAQKPSPDTPTITVDALLRDVGCYATNNVFHAAVTNAPSYAGVDFSDCDLMVYARERASSDAASWFELTPRKKFSQQPADYAIENATNFNYMVYLDYVPPSPVHTNGVFELYGFVVPDDEPGNLEQLSAGFINSRVATIGDYWFWPSEIVRVFKNPQSVWTPQTGIWYGSFASNGYANDSSGKDYQTFTTNSYHNFNLGGYNMVQFFALPAGVYTLSFDYVCEVQTDDAGVSVFQYVRDGAAYKHGGALTTNVSREQREGYKSEAHRFTVPVDVLIGCYISGRNTNGHRGADIWNVHLVKLP